MSIKLPPPPKVEMLITLDRDGKPSINQGVLRDIRLYFEALFKVLSLQISSISWGSIGFAGSKLTDIETRSHSSLQGVAVLNTQSVSVEQDKHISNAQGKAWEDHRILTTTAHGGIIANTDARLTDARTPTVHDSSKHSVSYEVAANKDQASGYAGLNAASRTTKGSITTDDHIVNDATKGLVLKDTQGTPHYWRVTVDNTGALVITDLGTSAP